MKKKFKAFNLDNSIANSKFDYAKNLKWFIIAPIALFVIALVLLCTVGFNLGIDFTGGSIMKICANSKSTFESTQQYDTSNDDDYNTMTSKINETLKKFGLSASVFQKTTMVIKQNDNDETGTEVDAVLVKFQNASGATAEEIEDTNKEIRLALLQAFGYLDSTATVDDLSGDEFAVKAVTSDGTTTAAASSELLMNAFLALLVAMILIMIYIFIRFDFVSGLAAILALFQDVVVTCAFMLMFRVTVNSGFIAAIITIIGYSINNTIIIFDQIRENIKSGTTIGKTNSQIANQAVNQTMTRSIFTTLTTFLVIFFVMVIGVSDIRDFAFPIMIGILAGFYSSVFLTPGLWAIAYKPKKKSKAKDSATL